MAGTDYRNGSGYSSRTAEFATGMGITGSASSYNIKQNFNPTTTSSPSGYTPSSVLSSVGSINGQSPSTYTANRSLAYNRGA
jgi:hypothetical protein